MADVAMISREEIASLPLLMSTRQTAYVGGWSEKFVRDMLAAGKVKGVKVGGVWRVNRDALLAQLGLA